MQDVLAMVLAGGRGARLKPLTRDRAKPAVPFAGTYRIIDFTLSNCLNSGLRKVQVLTQYKSASLDRHIHSGWSQFFQRGIGDYLDITPPQQRVSEDWYLGTADAVFQNLYSLRKAGAKYVLVLAGDHIYKMDYRPMVEQHVVTGSAATVGCIRVPTHEAALQFGVMRVDPEQRIVAFAEKPAVPEPIPGDPANCLASMGIYVFTTSFLLDELSRNATQGGPDFGHHLLPEVVSRGLARAHVYQGTDYDEPYWRDVGTLEAYYQASLELLDPEAPLNLFDSRWPVRTYEPTLPPPRVALIDGGARGEAPRPSMIAAGTRIEGARVDGCVIGRNCRIAADAVLEQCILFDGVQVGAGAVLRRAILDKHARVAPGASIEAAAIPSANSEVVVTENGIVCIAKGMPYLPSGQMAGR